MSNEKFTPMKKNAFFLKRAMAKHYGSKCIYCGKELMYRAYRTGSK